MKRVLSLGMACLLLATALLCALPVHAAGGTLSVTASTSIATVGDNLTVTLTYDGGGKPIGGIDGTVTFDTNVFSYLSYAGTDVQVNGGAGILKFIFTPMGEQAPGSVAITFTFKANVPGGGDFSVATKEFFDDNDYLSLGSPAGKVSVTASNPTLSGNADLKSLVPSRGTLSPKFNPDVTDYTISVNNSVTSLSLSISTDHADAKTSISGKNALQVGKNTRVITVTAPNGTTKKYTVVITRGAAPTNQTTGTTTPPPPADALEVTINGKPMTILDVQAPVELPEGFRWSNRTINRVEVPAAVHTDTAMTLLYLVSEDGQGDGFFIYDSQQDSLTPFRALSVGGGSYLLFDLPVGAAAPAGTAMGTLTYDGGTISAFVYEDVALQDFYILQAALVGGDVGWYTYDAAEKTIQRYHATPNGGGEIPLPSATTKPTTPTREQEEDNDAFSFGEFFENNQKILIIGLVVLAGVVVVVLLVVLIASMSRPRRGKH